MKQTEWKVIEDGKRRIRAEYGLRAIGNQAPYFAITAEIERASHGRWREDSCGCLHAEVAEHFPELAPLIRWHLCTPGTGPMHYLENAVYWWELAVGVSKWERRPYDPDPCKAFASHVVLGAVEGEGPSAWAENGNGRLQLVVTTIDGRQVLPADANRGTPEYHGSDVELVRWWLRSRLPDLDAAMRRDLAAAGVEVPAAK
jgi:hypothetical protein